jgi:hypothetical protein
MGQGTTDSTNWWMDWRGNTYGWIAWLDGTCKYVYDNNMGSLDWSGLNDPDGYRWWSSSTDIANGVYTLLNPSQTAMFQWSWHLLGSNAMANGTFQVVPYMAQGMALDANGAGTTNGTNVDIWSNANQTNESWIVTNMGSNWFKIQPSYDTALALDVYGSGTANNTNVDLWADNGGANQRWSVVSVANGFWIAPENAPTMALNDYGQGSTNGSNVEIWTWGGENASIWLFK